MRETNGYSLNQAGMPAMQFPSIILPDHDPGFNELMLLNTVTSIRCFRENAARKYRMIIVEGLNFK